MKQLTTLQTALFVFGAVIMVVGAMCVVFRVLVPVATVMFAVGAFIFAGIQMFVQSYEGNDFVVKRLRRIMFFSDVCFIVAALLMVESHFQLLRPYVATTIDSNNLWIRIVYNNWVVALLIGAILQMYSTHRISNELSKEKK